jgi:hypothetical protein
MSEKIYICSRDGCKAGFEKYAYLRSHFLGKHPGESPPPKDECEVETLPEGYTLRATKGSKKPVSASNPVKSPAQEASPEGGSPPPAQEEPQKVTPPSSQAPPTEGTTPPVYRTTPQLSNILRSILTKYPGIPGGVVDEILDWEEQQGSPLHPAQVAHLLNQMANVPKGASEIIPQKYALAMQKAAQQGNADVQMTVAGWQQYGTQQTGGNPLTMMPGQMFQQPGNQTGMPPMQYGVPYQMQGYPNYPPGQMYPGYQYGPYNVQNQQPPPQEGKQPDPETEARFNQMGEAVTGLTNLVENLSKQILETEQQKKEEALNARLDGMEKAILQLAQLPKTDENANALAEAIKDTQTQIALMREEATANKISSLEERIGTLTDALAQNKDNEIVNLKNQLDELKRTTSEKPPVTGRTEMDIVGDLANKVVEKMGEAGKDVRAVVMRQATAQGFDPNRSKPEDRAKLGDRIASVVEQEALLEQKEDQFRYQ